MARTWHGSNWIRKERRFAIYHRDGFSCVWCGVGIEDSNVELSLDHLIPAVDGGGNESTNLVTSCGKCNSSRGCMSIRDYATKVTSSKQSARNLLARIMYRIRKPLDMQAAMTIIASRKG